MRERRVVIDGEGRKIEGFHAKVAKHAKGLFSLHGLPWRALRPLREPVFLESDSRWREDRVAHPVQKFFVIRADRGECASAGDGAFADEVIRAEPDPASHRGEPVLSRQPE